MALFVFSKNSAREKWGDDDVPAAPTARLPRKVQRPKKKAEFQQAPVHRRISREGGHEPQRQKTKTKVRQWRRWRRGRQTAMEGGRIIPVFTYLFILFASDFKGGYGSGGGSVGEDGNRGDGA